MGLSTRTALLSPLALALLAGCGGDGEEEVKGVAPGLYVGTSVVVGSPLPSAAEYATATEVLPDGSVRAFGLREDENLPYPVLNYFVAAGELQPREAQLVVVEGLASSGTGTARQRNEAQFRFQDDGLSLALDARARSQPQPLTQFVRQNGSYRGRVFRFDLDARLSGFGTATGTVNGSQLDVQWRSEGYSVWRSQGRIIGDLGATGEVENVGIEIDGSLRNTGVTWSSNGSRLVIQFLNSRNVLAGSLELERQ